MLAYPLWFKRAYDLRKEAQAFMRKRKATLIVVLTVLIELLEVVVLLITKL